MPDELVEEIDDRRHSTVARSTWIVDAIRVRMLLEDEGDWEELYEHADRFEPDGSGEKGGVTVQT